MKKIIALTLLLAFAAASFGQQSVQKQPLTQGDYLKKSKNQKKAANIMAAVGAAAVLASFVIPAGEATSMAVFLVGASHKNDNIKSTVGSIGFITGLASIPFLSVMSQ